MKRLPGVTFSAVLLIVGGAISLVCILLAVLGLAVTAFAMPANSSKLLFFFQIMFDLIFLACAIWAVAAGAGLLRLRPWARISTIVFAALLLLVSLPGVVIVSLMSSFMTANQFGPAVKVIQVIFTVFYGLLACLAVWWLYYFNTQKVKDLFRARNLPIAPPVVQPLVAQPPALEPLPNGSPAKMKRPVSITVIAALMLIYAGMAPFSLVALVLMKFPAPIFGFWIAGWRGVAFLLSSFGVLLAAGLGLLKLRPWARILCICYLGFVIVNSVLTFVLPGSVERYQQIMSAMMSKFVPPNALPAGGTDILTPIAHMAFFAVMTGLIFGVLFSAVQLWFLLKEKPAFLAANQSQPNIS